MAKEEKSVRSQVMAIEERTAKLDGALKKLSDSLDRISESISKPAAEEKDKPSREELIKQFKQPFATPEAVAKESNDSEILEQIKDSIAFNQKDNFKLFKSIEETLIKIEQKGGTLGGGVDVKLPSGKGKQPKADAKAAPDKKGKTPPAASKAAQAAEKKAATSTLSKVGSGIAKAAKFLPGVGLAVGAGMAAYEGVQGYNNAEATLGIEGRQATPGEKAAAAGGSIVEGLTFGLVSGKSAGNFFAGMFGAGPDAKEKEKEAQKAVEAGVPPEQAAQVAEKKVEEGAPVGPIPTVVDKAAGTPTVSKPKPQTQQSSTPTVTPAPTSTPTASSAAPSVTPASTVAGDSKDTSLPEGVTKDPMSGAYKYKGVMFQASNKEAIDAHVKVIDGGGEASFEDVDRNTGMKVQKTISGGSDGVKITSMKPVEGDKAGEELAPASSSVSAPSASVEPAKTVNQVSQENADMKTETPAIQPVVISNQSTVNSSQQSFSPLRTTPRPNNNSFERKQMAVSEW